MIAIATAAAIAAAPTTPAPRCVQPGIAEVSGTAAFLKQFNPNSRNYATAVANIRQGFARACTAGLLAKPSIVTAGAGALHIENAPDANVASIFESDERERHLVLEYPFLASDGSVNLPTAEEVEEAIYCAVRGASVKEEEESGRCLAD